MDPNPTGSPKYQHRRVVLGPNPVQAIYSLGHIWKVLGSGPNRAIQALIGQSWVPVLSKHPRLWPRPSILGLQPQLDRPRFQPRYCSPCSRPYPGIPVFSALSKRPGVPAPLGRFYNPASTGLFQFLGLNLVVYGPDLFWLVHGPNPTE